MAVKQRDESQDYGITKAIPVPPLKQTINPAAAVLTSSRTCSLLSASAGTVLPPCEVFNLSLLHSG